MRRARLPPLSPGLGQGGTWETGWGTRGPCWVSASGCVGPWEPSTQHVALGGTPAWLSGTVFSSVRHAPSLIGVHVCSEEVDFLPGEEALWFDSCCSCDSPTGVN